MNIDKKKWQADELRAVRRSAAFPTREMAALTFDHDDRANKYITNIAHRYVDNFCVLRTMPDNNGLILYGGVGTGKTYIAACIVNALIDNGYDCYFTNFSRLVNHISGMYQGKQEFIDSLNKYELLVIDDLAAERETDYTHEIIFNVIDTRCNSRKPLIITTNLTAEQLKNPDTEKKRRIYSRLLERCTPVEVHGADRRKAKLKENYKVISDMLGI